MYALRTPPENQEPIRRKRKAPQPKQRSSHWSLAAEITVKLSVNVLLTLAGVTGLLQLIPYRDAQVKKLEELETAVQVSEQRNQKNFSTFSNTFDPYRTSAIMQDQGSRVAEHQQKVVLKKLPASVPQQATPPNE